MSLSEQDRSLIERVLGRPYGQWPPGTDSPNMVAIINAARAEGQNPRAASPRAESAVQILTDIAYGYASPLTGEDASAMIIAARRFFDTLTPTDAGQLERLWAALAGFGDDYMTSDAHHPDHVLVPVATFERVRKLAEEITDEQR